MICQNLILLETAQFDSAATGLGRADVTIDCNDEDMLRLPRLQLRLLLGSAQAGNSERPYRAEPYVFTAPLTNTNC